MRSNLNRVSAAFAVCLMILVAALPLATAVQPPRTTVYVHESNGRMCSNAG